MTGMQGIYHQNSVFFKKIKIKGTESSFYTSYLTDNEPSLLNSEGKCSLIRLSKAFDELLSSKEGENFIVFYQN